MHRDEPQRITQSGPKRDLNAHALRSLFFLEVIMNIPATTIKDQLSILRSRNVRLDASSDGILLQYGYYNLINGYKDAFIDAEQSKLRHMDFYVDGTTLEQIVALYRFDANLRRDILSCVTIIETQMKSLISLHFSSRFGTNHWNYLNPNSFTRRQKEARHVSSLLFKLSKSIKMFSTQKPHPAICHFVNKYNQVPLWVLSTVMSFGTMANFYDLLLDDMKKDIAHAINPRLTPSTLGSILYYLTGIRNKCAHNNRLYTHKIDQRATRLTAIPQMSIHKQLNLPILRPGAIYAYGQDDILAALICITVLFGQNHVYQINYDSLDQSLSFLATNISPSVEQFVRETTGLKHEYISGLKGISI